MPKRTKAYLALTTTTLIWGAALPIVKPALEFITPNQFLFFRYLIAAPILFPFFIYYLFKLKLKLKTLLKISLLEFIGAPLTLAILYQGVKLTTSIEASLIGATGPIFTVLGGIIFLKEKEEKREWWGLAVSFLGTLILIFQPLLSRNQQLNFSFTGNLLIIIQNIIWTAYLLLAKKHYQKIPKIFISSLSYLIALITFFTILQLTNLNTPLSLLFIPSVKIATIYMGLLGSIIGFTLYIYGQNLIEASEACLFTYLQGVIAIPFSIWLLQEQVYWTQIIAIAIISIGVILAEYRPRKIAT